MHVQMNKTELDRLLNSSSGPVVRELEKYTTRTETAAKRRCPVDDGTLRASIKSTIEQHGQTIVGKVFSDLEYAIYQHEGTGVYAGKGPIRPKSGKYLVFTPKKGGPMRAGQSGRKGGKVFAKEVKGTPPNPFLLDALRTTVPWPVAKH